MQIRHPTGAPRRATSLLALAGLAGLVASSGCATGAARGAEASAAGPTVSDARAEPLRAAIDGVLRRALADSAFPGAYAVVGTRAGVLASGSVGSLDWRERTPPDDRTIWDLASLTKVVALTTAMMQLVERGLVDLDAPVRRYVPEYAGGDQVLVRHLLTHSGGMPAWRPLYKEAATPEQALAIALATAPDTTPGSRYVYSDLGAIVLGQVVARVSGEPFDRYVRRAIWEPLGMRETMFLPPAELRPRIAPTEVDPWRQRHLRGEVHDENAHALGGVSSHAGLFSTARDLARFARMLLGGGELEGRRVLDSATIARFTRVADSALSHRALGWETPSGSNSAGTMMSRRAFGHTGFTGTSLWVDPEHDVFVVLLTNRVNPTRENRRIGAVRTALADSVMRVVRAHSPTPPRP